MFQKSESHDPPPEARAGGMPGVDPHATFISADMKVGGDLTGVGEVRIDGQVGGNVYGRRVSIGPEGAVMGDIHAEFADIAGTVHGRIEAVSVFLASSAEVEGTITHNELEIETGAKLDSLRPWRPPGYFDQNRKW